MSIPFFSIFQLFQHQLSRSRLKSGSGMSCSSLKRWQLVPERREAAPQRKQRSAAGNPHGSRHPDSRRRSTAPKPTSAHNQKKPHGADRRQRSPDGRPAASSSGRVSGTTSCGEQKKIPPKRERYRNQNKDQSNKPKETTCFILEKIKPRRVEAIPNKIKNCHIEPQRKSSATPSGFSIDGNKVFKYEKN